MAEAAPRDDLSVLRQKRSAEDRLPARNRMPSDVPRRSSRLAWKTTHGVRLFMAAGSRTVCLLAIERLASSTTCNGQTGLRSGFLSGSFRKAAGGFFVRGGVPDGVRAAVVTFEGGTQVTARVRSNVWAVDAVRRPTHIEWVRRGTTVRVRVDERGIPRPDRD